MFLSLQFLQVTFLPTSLTVNFELFSWSHVRIAFIPNDHLCSRWKLRERRRHQSIRMYTTKLPDRFCLASKRRRCARTTSQNSTFIIKGANRDSSYLVQTSIYWDWRPASSPSPSSSSTVEVAGELCLWKTARLPDWRLYRPSMASKLIDDHFFHS